MPDISVVIPVLDEEDVIAAAIERVRTDGVEVIVVDGGSTDRTAEIAAGCGALVVGAPRGRALQMNAGAAVATGDLLLFLHADTLPPAAFVSAIERALADPAVVGGRFDVDLQPSNPLIRLTAALINLRSRWSRISTGDQCIFVRRAVFERLGGFPELPIMEDVAFSRLLKRAGGVACLHEKAVTSSRRWMKDGVVRTILLMWTLRFLYFCGVPPAELKKRYLDTR